MRAIRVCCRGFCGKVLPRAPLFRLRGRPRHHVSRRLVDQAVSCGADTSRRLQAVCRASRGWARGLAAFVSLSMHEVDACVVKVGDISVLCDRYGFAGTILQNYFAGRLCVGYFQNVELWLPARPIFCEAAFVSSACLVLFRWGEDFDRHHAPSWYG